MKRKIAIWGSGFVASKFAFSLGQDKIDLFIDNDKNKRGKTFFGKLIKYPDDIEDWSQLFIYVPYNYYDEIAKQLNKYGLRENIDFTQYGECNEVAYQVLKEDYEKNFLELSTVDPSLKNKIIFVAFETSIISRGYIDYFKRMQENSHEFSFALVLETIQDMGQYRKDLLFPCIKMPRMFGMDIYAAGKDEIILDQEQYTLIQTKGYLNEVAQWYRKRWDNIQHGYEYACVFYAYQYVAKLLDVLSPQRLILLSSFVPLQKIITEMCKERNISVCYTHLGVLPGTFSFDIFGEMGKSLPAVCARKFLDLPVEQSDLEKAEKIIDYLYSNKLNRKIQPKTTSLQEIKKRFNNNKPVVFFAGHHDFHSGTVPYTEEVKRYYSPIFEFSIDAAIYLGNMAKKYGWNIIFKPHPMVAAMCKKDIGKLPDNVFFWN